MNNCIRLFQTNGEDGYVSLEVNLHLAHDTKAAIEEARRLWTVLNRPNVLIKVPSTPDGLPAIRQLNSEGLNSNVTLLFGLTRYRQAGCGNLHCRSRSACRPRTTREPYILGGQLLFKPTKQAGYCNDCRNSGSASTR